MRSFTLVSPQELQKGGDSGGNTLAISTGPRIQTLRTLGLQLSMRPNYFGMFGAPGQY